MIDLKRLRYFVAVAEEAHFGRAANRLGISQPPLSEHIQALEASLNAKLLFRTTRSVSLTVEGEALLKHARAILHDTDRCQEIVNASRQQDIEALTLGILHAHTYTFLPGLLRSYFERYPAHRIHLVEYSTTEQIGKLLEGTIDIGLVREPIYHPSLRTQRLFSECYAVAVPTAWDIARKKTLSVRDLGGRSMIGYPSHDHRRSTQSLFRDFFHQYSVHPSDRFEVKTMHAALALVAAGCGFAPVPRSQMVLQLAGVAYRPFREPSPELSVGLAWREDKASPLVAEFVQLCQAHFAQPPRRSRARASS